MHLSNTFSASLTLFSDFTLFTPSTMDCLKINKALKLYNSQEFSVKEIVEMTGVSRATIYRYLKKGN